MSGLSDSPDRRESAGRRGKLPLRLPSGISQLRALIAVAPPGRVRARNLPLVSLTHRDDGHDRLWVLARLTDLERRTRINRQIASSFTANSMAAARSRPWAVQRATVRRADRGRRGRSGHVRRRSGRQASPLRPDVAGTLPTQSNTHCAIFLLYICLSADKITHIWRDDALIDRSRMHECQGFEPL